MKRFRVEDGRHRLGRHRIAFRNSRQLRKQMRAVACLRNRRAQTIGPYYAHHALRIARDNRLVFGMRFQRQHLSTVCFHQYVVGHIRQARKLQVRSLQLACRLMDGTYAYARRIRQSCFKAQQTFFVITFFAAFQHHGTPIGHVHLRAGGHDYARTRRQLVCQRAQKRGFSARTDNSRNTGLNMQQVA